MLFFGSASTRTTEDARASPLALLQKSSSISKTTNMLCIIIANGCVLLSLLRGKTAELHNLQSHVREEFKQIVVKKETHEPTHRSTVSIAHACCLCSSAWPLEEAHFQSKARISRRRTSVAGLFALSGGVAKVASLCRPLRRFVTAGCQESACILHEVC